MITLLARPMQTIRRYMLDRIVLRPSRGFIDHGDQRREVMSVRGQSLDCFVARNFGDDEAAELVVLKFPGTAGRAERSSSFPMPMLEDVRVEVWTWNPPGYGGSGGRASLKGMALAAADFSRTVIRREDVRPSTIWLCGNSLGCNTALHVADRMSEFDGPIGLLLRNPPPIAPVVKRIAGRYPMGRFIGPIAESVCDEMNATSTAPRIPYPAVFLQSQLDDLVPPSMQNDLIERYGGTRRVVELLGLDHDGVATDGQMRLIESEVRWLWQQTQRTTANWKTA